LPCPFVKSMDEIHPRVRVIGLGIKGVTVMVWVVFMEVLGSGAVGRMLYISPLGCMAVDQGRVMGLYLSAPNFGGPVRSF